MPNEETIRIYDADVPARDWLSGEETERLELLLAKGGTSQTRADIEAVAIFIETRCGKKINVDKLLKERLPDNLSEAVEVLTRPFFVLLRRRAERNLRTQATSSNLTQLRELETETAERLDVIRELIRERESGSDGN